MKHFFCLTTILSLTIASLLISCQNPVEVAKTEAQKSPMLPAFIDYHSDGTLAHLVYRSRFEYNDSHQLQSINDYLVSPSPATQPASPWAQFFYTNNQLTKISLSTISNDLDSAGASQLRLASFELNYVGQTVNARLIIASQEVNRSSFQLDQAGYPLKSNVRLGQLFLDNQGHLDYLAESKRSKTSNPSNFFEVLEQQYDQDQNVFSESKEYQLLAALLASSNRSVAAATGLVGLDNALTRNNLRYRTVQHCTALYGCYTSKSVSETQTTNSLGFPTQRSAPVGAMGTFSYTITYQ